MAASPVTQGPLPPVIMPAMLAAVETAAPQVGDAVPAKADAASPGPVDPDTASASPAGQRPAARTEPPVTAAKTEPDSSGPAPEAQTQAPVSLQAGQTDADLPAEAVPVADAVTRAAPATLLAPPAGSDPATAASTAPPVPQAASDLDGAPEALMPESPPQAVVTARLAVVAVPAPDSPDAPPVADATLGAQPPPAAPPETDPAAEPLPEARTEGTAGVAEVVQPDTAPAANSAPPGPAPAAPGAEVAATLATAARTAAAAVVLADTAAVPDAPPAAETLLAGGPAAAAASPGAVADPAPLLTQVQGTADTTVTDRARVAIARPEPAPAEPAPAQPAPAEPVLSTQAPAQQQTAVDEAGDVTADPSTDTLLPAQADLPQPGFQDAAGVTTGRLPRVEDPPVADSAPADTIDPASLPAIQRNAASFDNPQAKPVFSIILIDSGDYDRAALAAVPFPLTIAIDPTGPNAAETALLFRTAGHEVLILATAVPKGATPADLEVTFQSHFASLPGAVGVVDLPQDGFQGDRALAQQIVTVLAGGGYGLVTFEGGLNPADQAASSEGLPSTQVFRKLDAEGENMPTMRRYLDRAAFKAAQLGSVVVLGHTYPDTIAAVVAWAAEGRSATMALAPISVTMLGQ